MIIHDTVFIYYLLTLLNFVKYDNILEFFFQIFNNLFLISKTLRGGGRHNP
jgi:hypothetical protein